MIRLNLQWKTLFLPKNDLQSMNIDQFLLENWDNLQLKTLFLTLIDLHLSRVMRKPTFCICENKDPDQLRGNRKADQRLHR